MHSFPNLEPVYCSRMSSSKLLLDLHVGFSGNWYGGLVFPSLNIFQFVVIHTVKGFIVVSETEIDVFLEFPCFFDDPVNVGNLISGSSAFSKSSLCICKFLVHVLLKPAWKILSITLLACEMSAYFSIVLGKNMKEVEPFLERIPTIGVPSFLILLHRLQEPSVLECPFLQPPRMHFQETPPPPSHLCCIAITKTQWHVAMHVSFFLGVCKWARAWLTNYDTDIDPGTVQSKSATRRPVRVHCYSHAFLPPTLSFPSQLTH